MTPVIANVTRLGADGDGIAQAPDGRKLYIPFALPDETVIARPVGRRGEGWAGKVEEIVAPSPERVVPPCPRFGLCGGCAVQHWRDDRYAAWKQDLLDAALRRAGFSDPPIANLVRTPQAVRRRADLALARKPGGVRIGLHRHRGSEISDITGCVVLDPRLLALIEPLRAVLERGRMLRRDGSAIVNLLDTGPDILFRADGEPDPDERVRLTEFARTNGVPRLTWARGDGAAETIAQLGPAEVALSGINVAPPPGAFLQASREGEAAIVAAVLAGLPPALPRKARVVELFAGCGTLSFALAQTVRVSAFEGDQDAVAALRAAAGRAAAGRAAAGRAAARRAGFAGRIEATRRDLARQPLQASEFAKTAAVVLDPPFTGAAAQMPPLAASNVDRIIYVSCNPAALARDARVLRDGGYRLLSAVPIDQFLYSPRLEAVAVFAR